MEEDIVEHLFITILQQELIQWMYRMPMDVSSQLLYQSVIRQVRVQYRSHQRMPLAELPMDRSPLEQSPEALRHILTSLTEEDIVQLLFIIILQQALIQWMYRMPMDVSFLHRSRSMARQVLQQLL